MSSSADPNAPIPTTPEPTRPQPPGLVFAAPRRGKPPRHLSDLSPQERRDAVVALGEPAYRAKQLGTPWYGRLVDAPDAMPVVPKPVRAKLADALLPRLLTPVREW